MAFPVDPTQLALATAVMALGATVQGSVGFGLNLLAAPLLLLIDHRMVPGSVLIAAMSLVAMMTYRERSAVDFRGLGWAVAGRVLGTVAGAMTLASLSQRGISVGVGCVVVGAVVMSASGIHFGPTPRILVGAGLLAGFMGTTASTGGPPMALVYQHSAGATVRATLAGHFLIGAPMSLAGVAVAGRLGATEVMLGLALIPGVVIGFLASYFVAPILDRGFTRAAVLTVSAAAGLLVLVRELL